MMLHKQDLITNIGHPYSLEDMLAMGLMAIRGGSYYADPKLRERFESDKEFIDFYTALYEDGTMTDPLIQFFKYDSGATKDNNNIKVFRQIVNFEVGPQIKGKENLRFASTSRQAASQRKYTMATQNKSNALLMLRWFNHGDTEIPLFDRYTKEPLEGITSTFNGVTQTSSCLENHHPLTAKDAKGNYFSVHKIDKNLNPSALLASGNMLKYSHRHRFVDAILCTVPISLNHHFMVHKHERKNDGIDLSYFVQNNCLPEALRKKSLFNDIIHTQGIDIDYKTCYEAQFKDWYVQNKDTTLFDIDIKNPVHAELYLDRFRKKN